MLASLDNETIFKKVFTDHDVFQQFVKDLFDVDIVVSKIETEKKFQPPIANIDIKLDIYAETDDHRFVIEIQKIDYDYNFNRFLNYFISLILEQQKRGDKYDIPQTVLAIVVLTRPYKVAQLTGEPIQESVMTLDFDPRNFKDERVKLWKHKLLFLNPNPKYFNEEIPKNYQDWLNLFRASIEKNISIVLNLNNKGIAKATKLAEFDNLDSATLKEMKISESKKAMLSLEKNESKEEGKIEGKEETAIEMIKEKETNEKIKKYTSLSIERINELRKQIENE